VSEDGDSGKTYLWDLSAVSAETTGQDIPVLRLDLDEDVDFGVAFGPDGRLLAASGVNTHTMSSYIRLWQIDGFAVEALATLGGPLGSLPLDVALHPAGSLLATSYLNQDTVAGTIRLWDISQIQERGDESPVIANLYDEEGLIFLAFSPDGQVLAAGNGVGAVHLWDVASLLETGGPGAEVATLTGHDDLVFGLAFSPDGGLLASGSQDSTARLWDIEMALEGGGSGAEVTVLEGHEGWAYGVAFSPDGRWLATSDEGGTVRLWALEIEELRKVACSHAVRNLSWSEWQEYMGVDTPYRQTCPDVRVPSSVVEALVRQDKIDEALSALHQALELDPTLELDPEQEVVRLLRQIADEYVDLGDAQRAVSVLEQAQELDPSLDFVPEEWVAWALVDRAPYQVGNYHELFALLTEAVELAPVVKAEAAEVLWEFVGDNLYEDRISYEDAVAAIQQVVEWNPDYKTDGADPLFNLGQVYVDRGDYDQGLALLRQAAEWDSTLESSLRVEEARIQALQSAADGQFALAEAALDQLPEMDQVAWPASLRVAETYHAICRLALDQGGQVAATCRRAIELAEDLDELWLGLSLCLREGVAGLSDEIASACENFPAQAGQLSPGKIVRGTLEADQRHYYAFEGTQGQLVAIQISPASDTFDPVLSLIGPDGKVLVERDARGPGSFETIQTALPEDGTYSVVVEEYTRRAGAYTLTVELD
jgi:tetratricopeptide (TPR) repeat protein